jgi:hypothetical protein
VAEALRKWTEAEEQKLFDDYFSPLAGICPVCAHEVCMVMSHLGQTITLLLKCEGCSNKATVTRILPIEGRLHSTGTQDLTL